jgi:uncharacterized SAM-binding protein YcdF (DUF218 family)
MKNPVYIVDYAYGFHPSTCTPDYTSKLRSHAALRVLKKYPEAHVVLGADMRDVTENCGPLALMTQNFLIEEGVSPSQVLLNPKGADTLSETEAAYKLIKKHGMGTIVCTTSVFHAMRVWLIWFFRYGIYVSVWSTKHKPPFSEWVQELQKIPRDVFRALKRR